MQYGRFDDARREYVITTPRTPLPWINYLGSEEFFTLLSNTAGGYSFYRDARLRRLTRYRYNHAPLDQEGFHVYIRDGAPNRITGPVNLGNPGEFTVRELAETIIRITGSSSEIIYRPLPQDDPSRRRLDIALAQKTLGWSPKVSLEEGLRLTIDYFRNLKDF